MSENRNGKNLKVGNMYVGNRWSNVPDKFSLVLKKMVFCYEQGI